LVYKKKFAEKIIIDKFSQFATTFIKEIEQTTFSASAISSKRANFDEAQLTVNVLNTYLSS